DDFVGTITTVTNFGLFITLNELFIDGLIHISNLSAEYYEYNEREQALIGELGTTFKLGEQLLIKVAGVNMDLLQVDFALVEKVGEEPKKTKSKRSK
ncbi:MAG: S1 RNA-binding domain-containing protein, partial [Moraxella sp.]|uniref:S1 RNA-binding domain-containing protein n=1 Tax=Moraxella sp. TaxID=479 RepID=UPI0026DDA202